MRLWVADDKILIDAPSTDVRLAQIPGYGWQPTPRAWEFPSHPGIVAFALDILGGGLLVPEELRADTESWRSKLDQRKGDPLAAPRIEQNRYCLDHDAEEADWTVLIPTREPTSTGSRFLKHPAVLGLLQRVLCGSPDELATPPIEDQVRLNLGDDRDVSDLLDSDVGRLEAAGNEAIIEDADLHSHIQALEAAGAGAEWIDRVIQILRSAAAGKLSMNAESLPTTETSKHVSVIKLAAEIERQSPEDMRLQTCSELVNMMDWNERCDLLIGLLDPLDYLPTETIDDAALMRDCTAERIGLDPFEYKLQISDILDLCDSFTAYRRAINAYCDGSLFANPAALLMKDLQSYLRRVLDWFADRNDEGLLVLAFDTYARFLYETGLPDQLGELIQVCSNIGDRRALKVRSSLLVAQALHALDGGISSAIKHLVYTQRSLLFDYEDRELVCEEARLLAGQDSALTALLGDCGVRTEKSLPAKIPVGGRILVVGGQPRFKERGLRAIRQAFPGVDFEWLNSDEAKRPDRVRALINDGRRDVLLYTWVLSHSAEQVARAASEGANRNWARVRMPALAAVLREVPVVLGAA